MSEVGLVLGGGGGKGAYEAGAWRALCEAGLNRYITIYSGSSVGALNCAFIQLMDWRQISSIWLYHNLNKVFLAEGADLNEILKAIRMFMRGKKTKFNGLFSREGLIDFLYKTGIDDIENKNLDFYVAVTNITETPEDKRYIKTAVDWYKGKVSGYTQYIYLKDVNKNFFVDILLATTAIPILYPLEEIGGQYYADGGINDNLPIAPVYRRGCKKIIVVSLDRVNYNNIKRRFPDCDILLIQPSKNLGRLIDGTFNFNKNKLRHNYVLGYADAKRAISRNSLFVSSLYSLESAII